MAYRFGAFLYDPVSSGLLREGVEVPLTHKSRELLSLFLQNPGRLLTREEITERVWADAAITDDAVRFQVAELRKAFGPGGEAFIRTVRSEGYRWEEPVRAEAHRPVRPAAAGAGSGEPPRRRLLLLKSGEVPLVEGENIIGRDPDAALWIDHAAVSRHHAGIVIAGEKVTIADKGSKNGTFLNGERIERPRQLSDGDQIRIGPQTMVFRSMLPLGTTRTEQGTH
jgi:DNA-binding winged helix-turn-helix (wHTH) protein